MSSGKNQDSQDVQETGDHLSIFESSMDSFMLGHIGGNEEDGSDATVSSSDSTGSK